jgi:ActR/RegA family two-component response regulator
VDADDIVSALQAPLGGKAEAPQRPVSPANVRLQHIEQVHEASGRNVSETAPPQYASADIATDSQQTGWVSGLRFSSNDL